MGSFVAPVAPAERSRRGRMAERGGPVATVPLKGQLQSEVPGLGRREETRAQPCAGRAPAMKAARSEETEIFCS